MLGRARFGHADAAVWTPGPEHYARSRLAAAMQRWGVSTLEELHTASVNKPEWFWPAAAQDLGIPLRGTIRAVCDESGGRLFPRWFDGAQLNVVWSCVDRHAADPVLSPRQAVIYEGDGGQRRSLTPLLPTNFPPATLEWRPCVQAGRQMA